MNIKELDLSEYVIKTQSEYENFTKDIKEVFPIIKQNYCEEKVILVNFILGLEKIYNEHPEIEKIGFVYDQYSSCEDSRNRMYIHGLDFKVINADTKETVESKATKDFVNYLQDEYTEIVYGGEQSFEAGRDVFDRMSESLFWESFEYTSRDDRFKIYHDIAEFPYFDDSKHLHNIVNNIEKNEEINTQYKKIFFLGKEIDIQTINVKDGYFKLDVYENEIEKIKNKLESIECSYVINEIKEAVLRNNLNTEGDIKIQFDMKNSENSYSKDEYLNYNIKLTDQDKNTVGIDVDFIFRKFLYKKSESIPFEKFDRILTLKLLSLDNSNYLHKRLSNDEKIREDNYTDVNTFIKTENRPKFKM